MKLHLISHKLCPFVQRAVITLSEKGVAFERTMIDLENKPDWFTKISPLGKAPVLVADETPIFESAVIAEFLEETQPAPLHPEDPVLRAQNRAWIEFGSVLMMDLFRFMTAPDADGFAAGRATAEAKLDRLQDALGDGPFFNGAAFSLVDASIAPIFRYFPILARADGVDLLAERPKLSDWGATLLARPSVANAVDGDFEQAFEALLARRGAHLATLLAA